MLLIIPRLYVIFPLQIVIVFVCTHFQERSLFPLLLLSRPFMVFLNPPSILCERSKRSRFKQWFTSHSFFTHTWVSKGQFGRLNEIFKQLLSRPVVSREVDSWPVPDSAYPTAVISTDFFYTLHLYILLVVWLEISDIQHDASFLWILPSFSRRSDTFSPCSDHRLYCRAPRPRSTWAHQRTRGLSVLF